MSARLPSLEGESCVCCGKPAEHWHHRQPKSQNGSNLRKNLAGCCFKHHEDYNNVCGQRLAMRVQDRVTNFARWIQDCGVMVNMMGEPVDKKRPRPWMMAPPFVQQEYSDWSVLQIMGDQSKGCLSRIDKIEKFERREF